jgi:GNAT superfamily N-acetyltransferase
MSDYLVSSDRGRIDVEFVVSSLHTTYWAGTRSREDIIESMERSLCFGVFENESGRQVGLARVVTDGVTFSWICDVFVDPAHRGRGLGKRLVAEVLAHPDVKRTRAYLGTRDAHTLYERFGFKRRKLMRRDQSPLQEGAEG